MNNLKTVKLPAAGNKIVKLSVGEMGIENIKTSFTALIQVGEKIEKLFANFSIGNAFTFGIELFEMRSTLPIFKLALQEFKDLTPSESLELSNHFKNEFDISNNELEAKIEKVIELIPATYTHIKNSIDLGIDWADTLKSLKKAA